MTGEIEAAGDLIRGTLLSRAIEPSAGEAADGETSPLCLNCGTRLIGPHCHVCGQSAHVHRTIGAIGHEIAHGVFHFEGKVWRTLPMLALHPGALTRRYVAGERARFVSPLALFLFTVFLLFASLSWVGADPSAVTRGIHRSQQLTGLAQARAKMQRKLEERQAAREQAVRAHQPTDEIDRDIRGLTAAVGAVTPATMMAKGDDDRVISADKMAGITTGWSRLDEGLRHANDNPDLALYKLQQSAYKYSWLLIPLSTPFVAMLFLWRRRFGLYDHAVFVTYSLCFMMLLLVALLLAGAAGVPTALIATIAVFVPPIHIFAQLRGAYSLRWFSAGWRTTLLLGFTFTVLVIFALLLIAHGLTE